MNTVRFRDSPQTSGCCVAQLSRKIRFPDSFYFMIMDQCVVDFEFAMLYFDLYELIQLIKESDNDELKCYVDSLQEIFDNETA